MRGGGLRGAWPSAGLPGTAGRGQAREGRLQSKVPKSRTLEGFTRWEVPGCSVRDLGSVKVDLPQPRLSSAHQGPLRPEALPDRRFLVLLFSLCSEGFTQQLNRPA